MTDTGSPGAGVTLLCPVRGCRQPLARAGRALGCARGHRFDLARSGYCNLLQPQDRRSRHPGDSAAAVTARRRLFDAGHGDWLLPHLRAALATLATPATPSRPWRAVLDVGCGEGFYLDALTRAGSAATAEAHGLDISTAAVDLAARRYPAATWVVANADRDLPYAAGSFDLALALTARLNPAELRRVLAPSGCLLIAVPGDDDLVELRAAVLGRGELRDRLQPAVAALAADFELVHQARAAAVLRLPPDGLRDLLAATYRGGRERQRPLAAALGELTVTASRDLAVFRPRRHSGPPPLAAAGPDAAREG